MLKGALCVIIAFVTIDKGTSLEHGLGTVWGGESVARYMQKFDKSKPPANSSTPADPPEDSLDESDIDSEELADARRHNEDKSPDVREWEDRLADDKTSWGWPWHGDVNEWLRKQEETTRQTRRNFQDNYFVFRRQFPINKFQFFRVSEWEKGAKCPHRAASGKGWGWPFEDDGTLDMLKELGKSIRKRKKIKRLLHRNRSPRKSTTTRLYPLNRMRPEMPVSEAPEFL